MSLTFVMPQFLQEWRHEGPIQRRRPSYGTSRAFSGYCRVFIWSCQVHHPQETSRTMSLDQLYADLNYSQGFWLNVVSLSWKLVYIPRDHAYLIRREDHVCSNKEQNYQKCYHFRYKKFWAHAVPLRDNSQCLRCKNTTGVRSGLEWYLRILYQSSHDQVHALFYLTDYSDSQITKIWFLEDSWLLIQSNF
jgi:hypothetical protein